MIDPKFFGCLLRNARLGRELTLLELSKKTDIPIGTLSRYENGRRLPKLDFMYRLSLTLGFSIDELLQEVDVL